MSHREGGEPPSPHAGHTGHAGFASEPRCWVCDGTDFRPMTVARFTHSQFKETDPELFRYGGAQVRLVRCRACGFGQPEALPALPRYFERMYAQEWGTEWMEEEFRSDYKDLIFGTVLDGLERRVAAERRSLLDVGAHVGRFIMLAARRGWRAEGMEPNPRTSEFAARSTGLPIHRVDAAALEARGLRYGAVTITDVLEHIPHPRDVLRALRRVMEPGGWIAVKVPNGQAQLVKERVRAALIPRYSGAVGTNLVHVNQFDPGSLRRALELAGFGDVWMTTGAPDLVPPPKPMVRRAIRVGGNLVRLAVWNASRRLPGGPRTPLALHLQAFARAI